jgi:pyruvoyl-dependent arginine decarboxylase (PvlArgDC)
MTKVDAELARLDALVAGEIAAFDAALRQQGIEVVGPARG